MEISFMEHEGINVIQLSGELDSNTAMPVYEDITAKVSENSQLVLDMGGVSYMSSAGIRTLLLLYREVKEIGGRIVLVGLSDMLQETLDITGFLEYFEARETLEEGIQAVR